MQGNNFDYTSICHLGIHSSLISDLDVDNLIKELYYIKDSQPSVSRSNIGGYQTESNLHFNPKFFPLVKNLNNIIIELSSNPNTRINSLWGNISSFNNYNTIHTHSPTHSLLSGVLYLKIPKNSGRIFFRNPLEINSTTIFSPQEKELLIFNSNIPHSVEPNLSQEDRISIAFNYG